MKPYIKELQRKLTTKEITVDLPSSITNLLTSYVLTGDIELERFVSNSIKQYLLLDINPTIYPSNNTAGLIIRLPYVLLIKLWWIAKKNSCTISQIATEALGFSIPVLLDEIQALEDYSIELTQGDI